PVVGLQAMRLAEMRDRRFAVARAPQVLGDLEVRGRLADLARPRPRPLHHLVWNERVPALGALLDPVSEGRLVSIVPADLPGLLDQAGDVGIEVAHLAARKPEPAPLR